MFWLRPFGLLLATAAVVFGVTGVMTVRHRAEQLLHSGKAVATLKAAPAPSRKKNAVTLGISRPKPLSIVYTFRARNGRRYDFVPPMGLPRIVALVYKAERMRIVYNIDNPKQAHMDAWLLIWIGPLLCFAFSGTVVMIGLLSAVAPRLGFLVLDAVGTPFAFRRPLYRILFESPRLGIRRMIERYWVERARRRDRRVAQLQVAERLTTRRAV